MSPALRTYLRRLLRSGSNGSLRTLSPGEAYDRWAASYRSRMNPVQELEEDALVRLLPDLEGKCVLDLGCGTGRISRIALECGAASTVGVDISDAMLDRALVQSAAFWRDLAESRGEPRSSSDAPVRWLNADVCALPLKASSFDVVVCALALGHVERLGDALSEMHRVLKMGGSVVISGFHPFASLRGWDRTFKDPSSGQTYAITQHIHLFQDYFNRFRAHGWTLEAFEEPLYDGYPIVFVLRARKAGRQGAAEEVEA